MKLIEAISLRIKELMQERNITQYRLGQVCNIPHTTLSNIFCSICKSVYCRKCGQYVFRKESEVFHTFQRNGPCFRLQKRRRRNRSVDR